MNILREFTLAALSILLTQIQAPLRWKGSTASSWHISASNKRIVNFHPCSLGHSLLYVKLSGPPTTATTTMVSSCLQFGAMHTKAVWVKLREKGSRDKYLE